MSGKQRGRFITGLVGLLLSLGYTATAVTGLPRGTLAQPGAAIFPIVVGVLMALASVGLIAEQVRLAGQAKDGALYLPAGEDRRRLLVVTGIILVYLLALPHLGFLPATTLGSIAFVHQLKLKGRTWPSIVLTGLAIAVFTWVLFFIILGVPMPKGFVEGLFE